MASPRIEASTSPAAARARTISASTSRPQPLPGNLPLHVDTSATATTNGSAASPSPAPSSHTPRPTPTGGGRIGACAACKYQRRKCKSDCLLAPYFPADQQRRFLNAHRLFGVGNLQKMLHQIEPKLADDAMTSHIYEADAWAADPVGGCVGIIEELQRRIHNVQMKLEYVRHQITIYRRQTANPAGQDNIIAVAGQQPTSECSGQIFHAQQDHVVTVQDYVLQDQNQQDYHLLQDQNQQDYHVLQDQDQNQQDFHVLQDKNQQDFHVLQDQNQQDYHVLQLQEQNQQDYHVLQDQNQQDFHVLQDQNQQDYHVLQLQEKNHQDYHVLQLQEKNHQDYNILQEPNQRDRNHISSQSQHQQICNVIAGTAAVRMHTYSFAEARSRLALGNMKPQVLPPAKPQILPGPPVVSPVVSPEEWLMSPEESTASEWTRYINFC